MNELINEVVNKLSSSELQFKEENKKPMNAIIASLKMTRKTNILEGFDTEFQSVHPSFYEKLTHDFPDLTPNEKRLCAFLKLNLNTKEISEITHLEMSSVEKARTRLRKKLELTGSDRSLSQFLQAY
jgi:DNA-binding CsgD family transcriptional regulator